MNLNHHNYEISPLKLGLTFITPSDNIVTVGQKNTSAFIGDESERVREKEREKERERERETKTKNQFFKNEAD